MADKECYCTVANDGVAVCVCKYRPCEKLKRKEQELEKYKEEVNRLNKVGYCYAYEKDCHKICKQQNCMIKNGYRYKQALDEIEEVCKNGAYDEFRMPLDECSVILDIINKAKEK